jgi:flagellar protein FliO/FliZ
MSTRFAEPTEQVAAQSVIDASGLLQITLSLALVLAFIFLIGWLLRRVRQVSGVTGVNLRVIDEVMVGARERVVTLETAGVRLVLGVAEGRVSLLHRYSAPPNKESATDADGSTRLQVPPRGPRWLQLLQQGLRR